MVDDTPDGVKPGVEAGAAIGRNRLAAHEPVTDWLWAPVGGASGGRVEVLLRTG